MQVTLDLLRKLVSELSEYQFFIISPITRYISGSCCNAENHVSNSGDPEFLNTILSGLTKLKFLLRKKLAPATVLDGIELICGPGCGKERMEQTLRTGLVDPVHPKPHIYLKMALNLIEKVVASGNSAQSQKRKRSESSESASSSQERQVTGRGASNRGGHAGRSGRSGPASPPGQHARSDQVPLPREPQLQPRLPHQQQFVDSPQGQRRPPRRTRGRQRPRPWRRARPR
jgi:hypothetical protein